MATDYTPSECVMTDTTQKLVNQMRQHAESYRSTARIKNPRVDQYVHSTAWNNEAVLADAVADHMENLQAEVERLRERYQDLIYEVATKWPNETRHETAKRYIHEAENRPIAGPCEALRDD